MAAGPLGFIKLFRNHRRGEWPGWIEGDYGPKPEPRVLAGDLRFSLINHATVLIQIAGLNILTDPIWSYRCSPLSWAGPRRYRNPGIRFEDLPPIDLVLISHNHYDHMDLPTLKRLQRRDAPLVVTGTGNAKVLRRAGIENVTELDWWRSVNRNDVTFTFVPAQHFSGRGLWDRNRTLWGGFYIRTPDTKVYFAGDTGYSAHFRELFLRFGAPDLSFLPIGAYKPRDFMGYVHMDPFDAVRAHQDLRSRLSVGIHYGTFRLAFDAYEDPVKDFTAAIRKAALPPSAFILTEHGHTYSLRDIREREELLKGAI